MRARILVSRRPQLFGAPGTSSATALYLASSRASNFLNCASAAAAAAAAAAAHERGWCEHVHVLTSPQHTHS